MFDGFELHVDDDDRSPNLADKLREAEAELERLRKREAERAEVLTEIRADLAAVLEKQLTAATAATKRRQAERERLLEQSRRRSPWRLFLDSFSDD